MKKARILFFQNALPLYRHPLFYELSRFFDLTICTNYHELNRPDKTQSNKLYLKFYRRFSAFGLYLRILPITLDLNTFDAIIIEANPRYLDNLLLSLSKHRNKVIYWGPWLSANFIANIIHDYCIKKFSRTILYSGVHLNQFIKYGVPSSKLVVANNTIESSAIKINEKLKSPKLRFIAVGSLHLRKGFDKLLLAYLLYSRITVTNCMPLDIIGDGPDKGRLVSVVNKYRLSDKVRFIGRIECQDTLKEFFLHSIGCFSYSQAGLTVLQSLAYATPFVCHKDALSGGEISNITNGYNGFLVSSILEMASIMHLLATDTCLLNTLSANALATFESDANFQHMISVFMDTIREL